jgi:hypothetical protein
VSARIGPDDLRALVRQVLLETLPGAVAAAGPPAGTSPAAGGPAAGWQTVAVSTDADLDRFVQHLLALFEDPRRRQDLRAGRLRFRLATPPPPPTPAAPTAPSPTEPSPTAAGAPAQALPGGDRPVVRIERGAVTEARVREASRSGARLVLGRAAVLTPLARDRARGLALPIEKER